VRVIAPTPLLAQATEVLAPVQDFVVVVGAAALEVALADAADVAITPTRDVDTVVPTDRAAEVIAHLEAAQLRPSEVPHERLFTWVRGDLKVQLVRSFHPFAKPPAQGLPANPIYALPASTVHQVQVAFTDDPSVPRLSCANAACLLALKQAAFGRTRPGDTQVVGRDFHDAYLLITAAADSLLADLAVAEYEVRVRAANAVAQLAEGGEATMRAATQIVALGMASSQRAAEAQVRRAAARIHGRLPTQPAAPSSSA
jgi:hypothetical protein